MMGLLADRAGGESGEARAVRHQPVEQPRGHELRVRLPVHVHELREQELDVVLADVALDVPNRARRQEALAVHGRHAGKRNGSRRARQCGNRTYR